jgi:poxvirus D5 protein-like
MSKWNGNDLVFKGYAIGKGKKPIQKVKNANLKSWDDVIDSESFGAILNSEFIDISFDSEELSDMFFEMADSNNWNCLILENPRNKHIHTYWRNPDKRITRGGEDKKLAVGLIADIHSGSTYIPLRVNGVDRFPPHFEPDEIDVVPNELLPVNTSIDVLGLTEGDGRNGELYKYILVLQSQLNLSRDEIIEILKNINNHVFDEPLDDNEIETITRDEAFEAPIFFKKNAFLFDTFARYIKNQYHIKRINNQLHIYDDGIYTASYRLIESKMIEIIPNLKATQRSETLKYLEIITPNNEEPFSSNYLAFRNGILNLTTKELLPFSPEYAITNKIPWDYNTNAYDQTVDLTLNKIACNDESIRSLLEECIGYCFYRRNELSKSFILTGTGSNGKSTFLDMVRNVLGRNNYVSLDIDELSEKFSTTTMFGKLANIGDDISDEFLQGKAISQFKKIVSGNDIKAENKGQDVFFFKPSVKLLFSANEIPRVRNKGFKAIKRRLVIIPFNAEFSKDDPDYKWNIINLLTEQTATEYLIQLGLQGLERVLMNNGFTDSEAVTKQIDEFEKDNNPIIQFVDEFGEDAILNESTSEVFTMYDSFCYKNGFSKVSQKKFSMEIKRLLECEIGDVKINGKKFRVFKSREL